MKLVVLEDEYPIFNPEARLIKDFNAIIVRDRGSKGDRDGRKKKLATKELAFVHFISYYNSEFVTAYSQSDRPAAIRKHLDLPDNWKPDELVERAILTYKELIYTPSSDSLVEAREALFSANKIIRILRRQLESLLQELDLDIGQLLDDKEGKKDYEDKLSKADSLYEKIMKIANKMPDTLDTIAKLEERVKKEMAKEDKGKGRTEVNPWEV